MAKSSLHVGLAEIEQAWVELKKYLRPSPLLYNVWLSEALECEVYLKLENMQPIGSFKIRGATYKISRLTPEERKRGVIAASAGNHAQGVAWGSRKLGVSALIVMPHNAALVKVQSTKALGAQIVFEGDTYDEAWTAAQRIAKESGRIFVHAFEDEAVIAGQGTAALELLEQLPGVDCVIGPMGGGGLMAGIGLALKAKKPKVEVIGCQSSGAPALVESIKSGKAVTTERVNTFADGIAVRTASEPMRQILSGVLDDVMGLDDEAIAGAVLTLLEKAKIITEGSGAVPLAALEQARARLKGKTVALIISGGNIDVNVLGRIIDRGLIKAGRRLRVNVWLIDRPGSLARLTDLIAKEGANVIQTIHDRSEPSTTIDETEVALTLETKGLEHSNQVIAALKKNVLRLELAH